jgi:threonine/homoserine/homoserine lactone efflux protein
VIDEEEGVCAVGVIGTGTLAAYVATVFVLMITPGPDMLFTLGTGIRSGPRAGFCAAVDAALCEAAHMLRTDHGVRRALLRGMVVNLLNPKMALFTIAFLPQFVDPSRGHMIPQFALLGAIFLILEIVVDGTVGLVAGRFGARLAARKGAFRKLNVATGSIYLGLAAKIAATR